MNCPHVPLESLCDRITDGTHQSPKFTSEGVPFLVISNVAQGTIDWNSVSKWVSQDTYAQLTAACHPEEGDVLYTAVGSFGIAVVVNSSRPFTFQRHIAHLKPNRQKLDARYLAHVLNSPTLRSQADRVARGVAQRTVTLGDLRSFEIPYPTLVEQRHIADILDKADTVRRKRKEAIALTEELLRSAFLEMFGDPVTNPKRWPVQPLGALADIASGVTKGKKYGDLKTVDVPYMRVANVQDGHIVLDEVKTILVSEDEAQRYVLKVGDVLLTEGGDPDKLGRGAVWRGEIDGCIHQNHIFRVRASDAVAPDYLSALIGSERGKRYFLKAAKQTTGIASINMTQLRSFPALVPPKELQRRYLEMLQRARAMRDDQRSSAKTLDDLFSSLVYRAFRGELTQRSTPTKPQLDLFPATSTTRSPR